MNKNTQQSSLVHQYQTVKQTAGIFNLSHTTQITLQGKDSKKFLHSILTQNITNLHPGQGLHAALLQTNGKLVCEMKLHDCGDFLLLQSDFPHATQLETFLRQRIFIADVQLCRRQSTLLSIQGPLSKVILEKVFRAPITTTSEYSNCQIECDGQSFIVVQVRRGLDLGYDLYSQDSVEGLCERIHAIEKLPLCSADLLDILRLEAGIPMWGLDITENLTPYEANLEEVLHFQKGCYIGQEVIARLKYRAKKRSNSVLQALKIDARIAPPPGSSVFLKEHIGHLTSSAFSFSLDYVLAFAYLKREVIHPDAVFSVRTDSETYTAQLYSPPPPL